MSMPRLFPERIEGRHVLLALLGFFGFMLLANGIFLYYAVGTFNGFETTDAYRKGLNYNQRIASDTAQAARGWQPSIFYDNGSNGSTRLKVEVRDAQGHAIAGLAISGQVRRPVTDRNDQLVTFREIAPGVYGTPLALAPGQWVVIAEASEVGSDTPTLRFKRRFSVKEAR